MNQTGKQGPHGGAADPKGKTHPPGRRNEAPRLPGSDNDVNPKTRAEAILQQSLEVDSAGKPTHRPEKGTKPSRAGAVHEQ
ncbi:hypothetical protein IB260_05805 [Pseudomonas sp. PDM23]|uniref:hypothetical protein n=1 Tax=unclassified Pseudomonas TaxID=196821 RepID=UPI0017836FCF|nr:MULTISPECIES: hypothetical protein [unclassified Pseudomonas]MBD9503760.1 hypothetical protein [Pseudomonas sp. PDM17]MBD9574818.1 hypothetical protein [Pseudomonas sp. PDM23]MBD9672979.1 hypothetical protein [Pseudomonas sp. PDM21]